MSRNKKIISCVTALFFGLVAYLLYQVLFEMDWEKVRGALSEVSWVGLFPAFMGTLINYSILASYDFLGIRYLDLSQIKYIKVLASSFVAYVFNLNLGGLVGGLGLRLRLYSGWKIPMAKIPLLFLFSTITNWLGYVFLLSLLFCFRSEEVEGLLGMSSHYVWPAGLLGVGVTLTYFVLSFKRYEFKFRDHVLKLPGIKLALLQLGLAVSQWSLLSGIMTFIFWKLNVPVNYLDILFTYLVASVAGVVTHIPGGIGVLEAVFLKMDLGIAKDKILAGLILFRLTYYILPLSMAIPGHLFIEIWQKKLNREIR